MKEEIIKPGIVRRIIERVENDNGLVISSETADIILIAFLETVADILSEGDIKDVIIIESAAVTLDSKVLLNIKEASDLFEIGQHRLREIVREDYGNKYHLMLGRTIKIKRKQFEEFIDNVEQI